MIQQQMGDANNVTQNNHKSFRQKPIQIDVPTNQENQTMNAYSKCQYTLGECCGFFRTWVPCLFCFCVNYPYQYVQQGTEGMFKRFGRHIKVVEPGLHYVNPCTDTMVPVDLRITVLDLERQSIMTKDNVTINIDTSVYYKIVTSRYSSYRVENIELAVKQLTYAVMKNTVGNFQLQDLLEKRQEIADQIEKHVEQYVDDWGVQIVNIYIKDIQLSRELQEALSSAATETRSAMAKLITARADVESAKLMREAAEYLNSQAAMQVRYLETIGTLGNAAGTKICFIQEESDKNKLMHNITQGLLA